MTPSRATCLLALAALCAPAPAEPPQRTLVGRDLSRRAVSRIVLDESVVRFHDAEGRPGSTPRDQVLAIVGADAGDLPPEPAIGRIVWREISDVKLDSNGRIELTDGQLYPGRLADAAAVKADHLLWDHGLLGRLDIPLDRLSAVVLRGEVSAAIPTGSSGDVLGLVNKDRVEGFVESIGPKVRVEVAGKKVEFALDRVAFARLANPARPVTGIRVWLSDATVTGVADIRSTDEATIEMSVPGREEKGRVRLPADEVLAVCFESEKLRPLALLGPPQVRTSGDRLFTPAPAVGDPTLSPLGAADIELPGPMSAEWKLPAGATRIAGAIELPQACRTWGDYTLVVEQVGARVTSLVREHINAAHPGATFNCALPTDENARLRISIQTGENGPIQNRAILHRVVVLVQK